MQWNEQTASAMASILADEIFEHTKQVLAGPKVDGRFTLLEKRLEGLETRNAFLETRNAELQSELSTLRTITLKSGDVWIANKMFQPGDTCTYNGSLWQCHEAHISSASGFSHGSWRLCVKKGADGRPGRDLR